MDRTHLALVGCAPGSSVARLLFPLLLASLLASSTSGRAATLDDYLRFMPSPSPDVVGYVIHVGGFPGFPLEQGGTLVDIGMDFDVVDGVGFVPLSEVIDGSAHLVMQAYDEDGLLSAPSNEIRVDIAAPPAPECTSDSDCADGDLCNGSERCDAGVCTVGQAPVCADPGPCAIGWCDGTRGCTSAPMADGSSCNDGDPGTTGDVCSAGVCIGQDPDESDQDTSEGDAFLLLFEHFESVRERGMPDDWTVTNHAGALAYQKYEVISAPDGARALALPWTVDDPYLAHYTGGGSEAWRSYEYIGRLRIQDPDGAIGATIVSGHPDRHEYVALLRDMEHPSFRLVMTPDDSPMQCVSGVDTGVVPEPGDWLLFRLRTRAEAYGLRIQAKVWSQMRIEPAEWAVDCLAGGRTATTGRPGVIAGGWEEKLVDWVAAWPLTALAQPPRMEAPLFREDFDDDETASDSIDWLDHDPAGVATEPGALFRVQEGPDGGSALAMAASDAPVFSRVVAPGASAWHDYEVTGRVLTTDRDGQPGILVHNRLIEGEGAIELGRASSWADYAITLRGVAGGTCKGVSTTGVEPRGGEWLRFRLSTITEGGSVRVRARLWDDGDPEPDVWQADCVTTQGVAPASGPVGVSAVGEGEKYWDDFEVRALDVP